jgi:hypothetical protein
MKNGEDMFGNGTSGIVDRYILPIISVAGPFAKGGSKLSEIVNYISVAQSVPAVYGPFIEKDE